MLNITASDKVKIIAKVSNSKAVPMQFFISYWYKRILNFLYLEAHRHHYIILERKHVRLCQLSTSWKTASPHKCESIIPNAFLTILKNKHLQFNSSLKPQKSLFIKIHLALRLHAPFWENKKIKLKIVLKILHCRLDLTGPCDCKKLIIYSINSYGPWVQLFNYYRRYTY